MSLDWNDQDRKILWTKRLRPKSHIPRSPNLCQMKLHYLFWNFYWSRRLMLCTMISIDC